MFVYNKFFFIFALKLLTWDFDLASTAKILTASLEEYVTFDSLHLLVKD